MDDEMEELMNVDEEVDQEVPTEKTDKKLCPKRNFFCYVCALYTPKQKHKNPKFINRTILQNYEQFFRIPYGHKLSYAPEIVCKSCSAGLAAVKRGEKRSIDYVSPALWLPIDEHNELDCYFCQTATIGKNYMHRKTMIYGDHVGTMLPARKSFEEFSFTASETTKNVNKRSVDEAPTEEDPDVVSEISTGGASTGSQEKSSGESAVSVYRPYYISPKKERKVVKLNQNRFDDLVRTLKLAPNLADILGSRLQEWGLTEQEFLLTKGRNRAYTAKFDQWFRTDVNSQLVYCRDIDGLFNELNFPHHPEQWRLFIDSSINSLKGKIDYVKNKCFFKSNSLKTI